ncbi:hypothetical protein P167DRAFT_163418 [Morchella conica CCBAS932]|uniref:Uncharacterized protein n=1 Tax=Morchella conica CCBAS932 TaxID=1392247 RepID=A0A3N4L315_9PEZI|nr:hypothetical protein P167DRAFT_163418 [Morchella conica CCBAS932]
MLFFWEGVKLAVPTHAITEMEVLSNSARLLVLNFMSWSSLTCVTIKPLICFVFILYLYYPPRKIPHVLSLSSPHVGYRWLIGGDYLDVFLVINSELQYR